MSPKKKANNKRQHTKANNKKQPTSFLESIFGETKKGLWNFIGWKLPILIIGVLLAASQITPEYVLSPSLEVTELECTVSTDKQVFSPDNMSLPGRPIHIEEDGAISQRNFFAPVLDCQYTEIGQTGTVYLVYKYSGREDENGWIVYRVNQGGFKFIPRVHTTEHVSLEMHFASDDLDSDTQIKHAYLVFNDVQHKSQCIYYLWITFSHTDRSYQVECKSWEELMAIIPYDRDNLPFSLQLDSIRKEIAEIKAMQLQ